MATNTSENTEFDLMDDEELDQILSSFDASSIPNEKKKVQCPVCSKLCASNRGLKRHTTNQHSETITPGTGTEGTSSSTRKSAEEILHPGNFKRILEKCFSKLSEDFCYTEAIRNAFKQNISAESISRCYDLIKEDIVKFKGDAEKFLPSFSSKFTVGNVFAELDKNCNVLLGFELSNHVLSFLVTKKFVDDSNYVDQSNRKTVENLGEKEKSVVAYLSGYVIGTIYRRIRLSKLKGLYHIQSLEFLMSCKLVDGSETDTSHQKLVDLRNRGGLWKIKSDAIAIFMIAESYFLSATATFVTKINAENLVTSIMQDTILLAYFNSVRRSCESEVKKEIAFNLMEDMLTLYVRVRAHSYARDKQQLHKISKSKTKNRSLRTELKKDSSSLDGGH